MTIRTMPANEAYRAGWERMFGEGRPRPYQALEDRIRREVMGQRDCEVCGRPAAVRLLDAEKRLVGRDCCWRGPA